MSCLQFFVAVYVQQMYRIDVNKSWEKAFQHFLFLLLGKQLYARNLSLLLPFFESPSIQLKELNKV